MSIKDVKLRKGMSREEINELIGEWLLLEDDIYLGANYKHSWKCKCGNIFIRQWNDMRSSKRVNCGCAEYIKQEERYKYEVEKDGDYEYIRSFRRGDILPNGKVVKTPYLQIKHKYCRSVYEVQSGQFINIGCTCSKCCGSYENSFAYHIEVELNEPLEKYWDFEKNTVNPYHIWKRGTEYVWIKCQNEEVNQLNGLKKKDYHGSYEVRCADFTNGNRCPYCNTFASKKVHPLDSFGYHNFDKVLSWHPNNDISPFRVAPNSGKKFKFICPECDYVWEAQLTNISSGRWCPQCNSSKGEKRITKWLRLNNINFINDEEYFEGLNGIGGKPLRPDFILPDHKIWIEYDGEFHYKKMYDNDSYEILKEHDKRKNEYAKQHGWKLIRIPYYDFDNIEGILKKELNI